MLSIEGLVVAYGLATAVRGVSLSVPGGRIVGVLGRNGAGKTTLLRAINGLIAVKAGTLRLNDVDITNRRPEAIARAGIGHVLEDRGIFADLTVSENLRASLTGIDRVSEVERMHEALELFPWLAERRAQLAGSLSGGQQQMVAIARALLRRPSFLLLDEPSKGLAPSVVGALATALRKTVRARGTGILLVEQSFDLLWGLSDSICVLGDGRIILAAPKESLSLEQVRAAYFGETGVAA